MLYNARFLFASQNNLLLEQSVPTPSPVNNALIKPPIEMVVGAWHLDEFGNPTREIKRRE